MRTQLGNLELRTCRSEKPIVFYAVSPSSRLVKVGSIAAQAVGRKPIVETSNRFHMSKPVSNVANSLNLLVPTQGSAEQRVA